MTTFVRSFDPIWVNFDLQGNLFDDTFYLWTLQNTLPYLPQAVYHDAAGQVPWTDPIQYLANGTLPVDIYWDPTLVYRLEFRHNINGLPPSQNDELIYEVNNYIPGSGGSITPIVGAGSITENQITNPQFALTSFASPLTLTAFALTPASPIPIGAGWELLLNGTGNAIITKIPLNSTLTTPTNAPYAVQFQLSGWTDSPILRQRFVQNGQNWSGLNVSTSITAKAGSLGQTITARLVDSLGTTIATPLSSAQGTLGTSFNEFTGFALVPATTNTNLPPAAYIDYQIILPQGDVTLTSIQVIASGVNVIAPFSYEQITVNREIDHTYNTAYPIVPVGTVIDFGGFGVPEHYLYCDGDNTLSRRDFNLLFQALTNLETVTLTTASPTITVANGAIYRIGAPIEGSGIQAGTLISTIVGNVVTMNLPATSTGPSVLRFFASNNGDGFVSVTPTTFGIYNFTGIIIAGDGGSILTHNAIGSEGDILQTGTGGPEVALLSKCIRYE